MSKQNEDDLNARVKQGLDDSVRDLDANTLSKVRQIRFQAIEKANVKKTDWSGVMSGALATACVMVFTVAILLKTPAIEPVSVDDFELISSSDNLELFEDLEFYEWLEDDVLPS